MNVPLPAAEWERQQAIEDEIALKEWGHAILEAEAEAEAREVLEAEARAARDDARACRRELAMLRRRLGELATDLHTQAREEQADADSCPAHAEHLRVYFNGTTTAYADAAHRLTAVLDQRD